MEVERPFYLIVDTGFVVVTHSHDGQHEIDEVEGAEKDDDHEKDDGIRTANSQHLVISIVELTIFQQQQWLNKI